MVVVSSLVGLLILFGQAALLRKRPDAAQETPAEERRKVA